MKKQTNLIVLLFLASTAIGCSIVGNLMKSSTRTYDSANTAANTKVNTEPEKPKFQALKDKADELGKLSPPVKLDPKAKIRGKYAIVQKTYYDTIELKGIHPDLNASFDYDLDNYGLNKQQLAVNADEIDTLIQINCEKGAAIGQYNVADGRVIPAYAVNCKISIIDYKTPAVVAEKTFVGKKLDKDTKVYDSTKDVTAHMPYEAMEKYMKKFPRE